MSTAGVVTMARIQWRTRRKAVVGWVLALGATLAGTAASIASLYDTPEEIRSYADAVAGGALYAINGKVEGIDSLGGVIQDEFGFMAAFLLPLLGISLIAGSTRSEEEAGRLELLLSGRIGRRSPTLAALIVTTMTIVAVVIAFILALLPTDVPTSSAILYAASLGGLVTIAVAGSILFRLSSALSMNDPSQIASMLSAGIAYLPAELVFAAIALLFFGMAPRFFPLAWGYHAVVAFIAFLGPGLNLSDWVLDLAPTTHVGNPPQGSVEVTALAVMSAIAIALGVAATVGFQWRDIPEH